ncbi:MAG: iron ABC transporter permease [Haloarculaceae archaeon]
MGTQDGHQTRASAAVYRRIREVLPASLTAVSVILALLLLSPVAWVLLRAAEVEPARAVSLVVDPGTAQIALNSVILVAAVTGASLLVGVPLAILTVQTDLPFRRFWTIVAALPLVVPSYIGAFAFVSAFGPRGVLQDVLAPLGVERIPTMYGLPGTVVVLTLFTYPYVYITTRAALLSFDGTVIEAARTLNHSRFQAFRRVTLPQIKPGIAAGALLTALYTLSDFGTPQIMRYDVFTRMIYVEYTNHNRGFAALLSILLLVMTLLILLWEARLNASREGAHVSTSARRAGRISLGRWKAPALAFCSSVAFLGLVVPLGILVMWLFRSSPGYAGGGFSFEWAYAWNSVLVAAGAAAVAVLVALPIAYLSARSDSLLSALPERATYVGYAMPGVVLGLSLVFLGLKYVNGLYRTVALLVFAYVVRFVPQAVGTLESSILQVDPKHAEAARSMGDSPLRSFRRVVLPQVTPGVFAGAALVFLTTMKELPATLLLRPPGFETFVTYIWQVQEQAYYGQAAVPALVLVGVSALSMLVILRGSGYDVT